VIFPGQRAGGRGRETGRAGEIFVTGCGGVGGANSQPHGVARGRFSVGSTRREGGVVRLGGGGASGDARKRGRMTEGIGIRNEAEAPTPAFGGALAGPARGSLRAVGVPGGLLRHSPAWEAPALRAWFGGHGPRLAYTRFGQRTLLRVRKETSPGTPRELVRP